MISDDDFERKMNTPFIIFWIFLGAIVLGLIILLIYNSVNYKDPYPNCDGADNDCKFCDMQGKPYVDMVQQSGKKYIKCGNEMYTFDTTVEDASNKMANAVIIHGLLTG